MHYIRNNDDLARLHLESAVALKGRAFVENWITADANTVPTGDKPAASGRGRKPGAAPTEVRCIWTFAGGDQCKNAKVADSSHCKIHASKAAAISAAAVSVVTG
jgi:hypothetical protein